MLFRVVFPPIAPLKRPCRQLISTTTSHEDLFRYTAGRWLQDEQCHQSLHFQRFNVDELKKIVLAVAGAGGITNFRKVAEGRCNKVFLAQLTGGRQVIARIPTPLAGPPHLVIASEVATMNFLRNRLGLTQVPRVLSSSSKSEDTLVGAEYIIMDVADGVVLGSVWDQLSMKQKMRVVYEWTKFESKVIKAFTGSTGYGSLYFRRDLPAESAHDVPLNGHTDEEFILGPSTLQMGFWEDLHGTPKDLELDRGPWADLPSYLQSISNTERAWIKRFAKPPPASGRNYFAPWEIPPHLQIPHDHLRALDQYDSIAKYFIPADNQFLRPTLTLRDSNETNIFLSREALERDVIEISAVIDWQHTTVLPLYLASHIPLFVAQAELACGQTEQQLQKEKAHLRKTYHALYQDTGVDVVWASSLSFDGKVTKAQQLPSAAQFCWHGGYVKLKLLLAEIAGSWESLIGRGIPCPLPPEQGSDEMIAQAEEDLTQWLDAEEAKETIANSVGAVTDGWVLSDDYEKAVAANEEVRRAWVEGLTEDEKAGLGGIDPTEIWPFDAPKRSS